MATLRQAEDTLGCSFYVPGDTVPNRQGENVPVSITSYPRHHRFSSRFSPVVFFINAVVRYTECFTGSME